MARKAGRKKFRRYIRGGVEEDLQLSTLGAKTLISGTFASAVTEKAFISSIVCTWTLGELTQAADDGPVLVGVAHSDYSDAEIEAWVEQGTSWDEGDLVSQEIARRKIKQVGVFGTTDISASESVALNDGLPIKTMCKWVLITGATLKFWAYNQGTSALSTTDPVLIVAGHANLFPS